MAHADASYIGAAREHSMGQVIPLRRINPRHPSLLPPTEMFDQDDPDLAAAAECVLLTKTEARLVAQVLRHAAGHVPSPKALTEAINLLEGRGRSAG